MTDDSQATGPSVRTDGRRPAVSQTPTAGAPAPKKRAKRELAVHCKRFEEVPWYRRDLRVMGSLLGFFFPPVTVALCVLG